MSEEIEPHIISRYQIVKKIGSGAYGHVWKVIDRKTRKIKALKKNFDAFNNSTDAQRTYRQIMFLMQLSHPNVIKLEEVIRAENNKDIYIVFEHMDIDLYTLIREGILAEKHKKFILYQVAKAIYFLHSAGLIHRDIKPSNILVNQNCEAKICDFGLVRSLDDEPLAIQNDILTEYIATRWYRAPELLLSSRNYSKSIDIWSFGCMVAQMQKGKPLFQGNSTMNQIQKVLMWTGAPTEQQIKSLKINSGQEIFKMLSKIKKVNHREILSHSSDECLDLIKRTLEFDPQKRLSIQQIITHPYLAEFYVEKDLIASELKIRVAIDDNKRLSLKQYRNIIYEEIRKKNKSTIDVNNATLYRIKNTTVRKNSVKRQIQEPFEEKKTVGVHYNEKQQQLSKKKNLYKRGPILLNKNRHLKTIQKQWNPIDLKKEQQKFLNTKYTQEWSRKKRSTTQSNYKKPHRLQPSPVQIRNKLAF